MTVGAFYDIQTPADAIRIDEILRSGAMAMTVLVEFDFASGPVRLCDRTVAVVDGDQGHTWGPAPQMARWQDIEGGEDSWAPLRIYELTVPLALAQRYGGDLGPFPDLSDKTEYYGRSATIYLQILDVAGNMDGSDAAVGKPAVLHTGTMDSLSVTVERGRVLHQLRVEGVLARKGVRGTGYLTSRDQKRRHPTDLGLSYVNTVAKGDVIWPNY